MSSTEQRVLIFCVALLAGCTPSGGCAPGGGFAAGLKQAQGDPYPLDGRSRDVGDEVECPQIELLTYRGEVLPLVPPVRVTPPFVQRVTRFERLSNELAMASFGRAPTAIKHAGAYVCRPVRQRSGRWSEHALGNALDVVGFDFPRLPRSKPGDAGTPLPELPAPLRKPFQVRVLKHWSAGPLPEDQLRQQFLRKLAAAVDEQAMFRGLIGPSDPQHKTHLHFDMGPWRYERL